MYASVLLLAAGTIAWLARMAVLIAKAYLEKRWLMLRYPDYQSYRKGTWRLAPGIY